MLFHGHLPSVFVEIKNIFYFPQHLVSDKRSRHPKMSESDLALTLECIHSVEVLITSPNLDMSTENKIVHEATDLHGLEENRCGDTRADKLLMFLIPVLISHLIVLGKNNETNSCWREKLNEMSLAKITEIGQRWPQQFRQVQFHSGSNKFGINS